MGQRVGRAIHFDRDCVAFDTEQLALELATTVDRREARELRIEAQELLELRQREERAVEAVEEE